MKKLISLFIIFNISNNINVISQPFKDISQYEFEKYAVEQGTAMNASLVIFEDLYGYLWLGSQSGVDRFDGYDFINYANVSSDSSSTNLKWVNAIAEDNNGNIWASDQFGNISNYLRSQDKWVNYYPIYKDSITNVPEGVNLEFTPQPRTILVSKDGRYAYVGVFGFGLIRIDSQNKSQKFYQDDFKYTQWMDINGADKSINEMEWLDDKRILMATGDGLRVFDIEEEKYYENGGSKANRLRTFFKLESNQRIGLLIKGLLDYWLSKIHMGEMDYDETDEKLHKEYNIPDDIPLIGNVAAVAPHKDYFTFINTAEELIKRNLKAKFFIIGAGPMEEEIKNYCAQKQLDKHIIFTGFRTDIKEILPELTVFLITSKTEGLGTSIIDAFACKVPVVATRAGGIPEIIEHEKNGLLADTKDAVELANQVERILNGSIDKSKIIEGQQEVLQNFSKSVTAEKTLKEYLSIL